MRPYSGQCKRCPGGSGIPRARERGEGGAKPSSFTSPFTLPLALPSPSGNCRLAQKPTITPTRTGMFGVCGSFGVSGIYPVYN